MNRQWLFPAFIGLLFGGGLGVAGWLWFMAIMGGNDGKPSALMAKFDFHVITNAAGQPVWTVIEDRRDDISFRVEQRHGRASRSIVAKITVPQADQDMLASKLENELQNWLARNARLTGSGGSATTKTMSHEGREHLVRTNYQSYSYHDGGKDGTIEYTFLGHDGIVTVVMVWLE